MISVLICDDDISAISTIQTTTESILNEADQKVQILAYTDPSLISNQIFSCCDIAFLDIDFVGASYNGMDIARKIRSLRNDTVIIFVTNFIEYAPEGYEVRAFRYILKRDLEADLKSILPIALKQLNQETLPIRTNGEIIKIPLDEILYLEVQQHNVTAVTRQQTPERTQKEYSFYGTLSDLEEHLEASCFLRIHKSYLVNMKHLKKFQCREATLDNGMTLRVSEKNYAENKKKFLLWKGWQ